MSEIITLNVGGKEYQTTKETLCKDPESMLSVMFSGSHSLLKDSQNRYFIDRDGELFSYILNYLRNQELLVPLENLFLVESLIREAEYFQISSLVLELKTLKESFTRISITYKELLILVNTKRFVQAPSVNLSYLQLNYLDLSHSNLRGCDFSWSVLTEVNFTRADLSNCIFSNATSKNCIFSNAKLDCSICIYANFSGNDLRGASMKSCNFLNAKLGGADMRNCDMEKANLQNANMIVSNLEGSNLQHSVTTNANFDGANCRGVQGIKF